MTTVIPLRSCLWSTAREVLEVPWGRQAGGCLGRQIMLQTLDYVEDVGHTPRLVVGQAAVGAESHWGCEGPFQAVVLSHTNDRLD